MIKQIKANLVFSMDLKSFFKSIWIGPLLITWSIDLYWCQIRNLDFSWYGWNYWFINEVEFDEVKNESTN